MVVTGASRGIGAAMAGDGGRAGAVVVTGAGRGIGAAMAGDGGRAGAVVVTGASRGIGAAMAIELARRGWTVACLSRSGEMPGDLRDRDGVSAHVCDVTDEAALSRVFAAVAEAAGGIAGLVNNAGIHRQTPSVQLSRDELDAVLNVNTVGPVLACREVHPHLVATGGGLIVNIGSFWDRLGVPRTVAYCASKAALGAVTRCLAVEWAADGITVVDVAPGYISTDMNRDYLASDSGRGRLARVPSGRAGEPEEVAAFVAGLFDGPVGYLTGSTIYMDGGLGISV